MGQMKVINDNYATDGTLVFWKKGNTLQPISGSDPSTFEVLERSPYFAKDCKQVYVKDSNRLIIFQPYKASDFLDCGWQAYVTDLDHLFNYYSNFEVSNSAKYLTLLNGDLPYNPENEKNAFVLNKATLMASYPEILGWWHPEYAFEQALLELGNEPFQIIGNACYFFEANLRLKAMVPNLIQGADAETFQALDAFYAKDCKQVYFHWNVVKGANPDKFEVLENKLGRDEDNYFYNGHLVSDLDRQHFVYLSEWSNLLRVVGRDPNHIFCTQVQLLGPNQNSDSVLAPIKGADVATFSIFSAHWAKDKASIYHYWKANKNIDVASFVHLTCVDQLNDFAKDKDFVYNINVLQKIKGLDAGSFHKLNAYWGKDKSSVYCFATQEKLKMADAASFKIVLEDKAEDLNYEYWIAAEKVQKRKK